jgi:hypothetical protein
MQRFRSLEAATLNPGDSGNLADGRSFKVVDAVAPHDGRCEFLAVTTFGSGGDDTPDGTAAAAAESRALSAEQLPLPYSLPD